MEPSFDSPFNNADRANVISPVTILESHEQEVGGRLIHIGIDQHGERYVRVSDRPEVQYFVSLLMTPACGLASVVRAGNQIYEDGENRGKPVYYSHMINMADIQPRSRAALDAELFLLDILADDLDHSATKNVQIIDNGSLAQYYIFDFSTDLKSLRQFSRGPFKSPWRVLARRAEESDSTTFISLLHDKVRTLQGLYNGEEGYELFISQLKEAGIDDYLTQIDPRAHELSMNPRMALYRQFIFRVNTLDDLLSRGNDIQVQLKELIAQSY